MFHWDAHCFNKVTNPKHSAKHLTPLFELCRYEIGIEVSVVSELESYSLATSLGDVLYRFEVWSHDGSKENCIPMVNKSDRLRYG